MDRKGWPWKKKSSDKISKAEKPVDTPESVGSTLSSVANLGDQKENCKNKNYVQISMESYARSSGLEDQVVNLEDQVKSLEAKLSAACSEIDTKDNLVKQHAKVAEEAVSGWEKADAEVASLRRELESMTLLKLSVDERSSHLDGALKECTRQIRLVKEESEQKLQEVILLKSQQWEKIKLELQAQINKLDKGLREEARENAALLRSLHDSSNKIVKLQEEKSEAEAEVELLKKNVQSYEKEVTTLKYEVHVMSKELDIRNEEKDIIMRSAEVANKQHGEDVKNIAKLEGECQRLRSLLRKKLPGPAALAQMRLEAESSLHVINGPHLRKTGSLRESEFLTKQLEVSEEETKTLKKALASSNAEMQASRNLYAKTVGRLKSFEAEVQVLHQERGAQKSVLAINYRNSSSRISSNPPSITSISDSGHEDPESPVESHTASFSGHSDTGRVKSSGKLDNHKSETFSELMDDFLEVEKMACLSDNDKVNDNAEDKHSDDTPKAGETDFSSPYQNCFDATNQKIEPDANSDYLPILKRIQSLISMIINAKSKDSDIWKLFEDLQGTLCELRGYLPPTSECPLCLKSNPNDRELDRDDCFPQLNSNFEVPKEISPGSELKDDKAAEHDECLQDIKENRLMLQENVELLVKQKAQLVSSQKSHSLVEIQLKCMTESYKSLQVHVEELEAENKFLKEKIDELKNDLAEEKQCHHDALVRYKEIEEKMQRTKCSLCASNSEANSDINTVKDKELAAAEKKLAECQETLHVLAKQLQAMCPQVGVNRVTMSHHSKRLQVNEMLTRPTCGWSNSCGSCNSDEIDQAEASSMSSHSDIQGASDEFSSQNFGSASDTEGNFSLNSSICSSQPCIESNSYSSASATGKHAQGLSHFFSSKEKINH